MIIDLVLQFSQSPRKGGFSFLLHFLTCQNQLINIQKLLKDMHKDVWYQAKLTILSSNPHNLSGMDCRAGILPKDLWDVSNANLSGHHLVYPSFYDAKMKGVNLENTNCNYVQCLKDNIANQENIDPEQFYEEFDIDPLIAVLETICYVYPLLFSNDDKAQLLKITSALASLPYSIESVVSKKYRTQTSCTAYFVKLDYWSLKLLLFKEKLGDLGNDLMCEEEENLKRREKEDCWKTGYPVDIYTQIVSIWCLRTTSKCLEKGVHLLIKAYLIPVEDEKVTSGTDFLKHFRDGLRLYNVKVVQDDLIRTTIEKNIEGLQEVYPSLMPQLQKRALDLLWGLSESYKKGKMDLLYHFLWHQSELTDFKKLVNTKVRDYIYYNS
ncbi:MAG: hypothetical protein AAF335_04075 [Bacteroidota bacterium]